MESYIEPCPGRGAEDSVPLPLPSLMLSLSKNKRRRRKERDLKIWELGDLNQLNVQIEVLSPARP